MTYSNSIMHLTLTNTPLSETDKLESTIRAKFDKDRMEKQGNIEGVKFCNELINQLNLK